MANTPENTPDKEVKQSPETPAAEAKAEEKKEVTVGEVVQQDSKKEVPKQEMVGLDKFLDLKDQLKEQKKLIKDLESRLADGETKEEILEDIDGLADEYNVDKRFLNKLVKAVKTSTEKELSSKLRPLEERENEDRISKAFNKHFTAAIESMPEYQNVVNPEVIKQLSLNPANSNKTFPQLIEETYGKVLSGKRTIEQARPRGGKEPESIDYSRARKDPAYLKEILSDPDLRREYNKDLTNRIGL